MVLYDVPADVSLPWQLQALPTLSGGNTDPTSQWKEN